MIGPGSLARPTRLGKRNHVDVTRLAPGRATSFLIHLPPRTRMALHRQPKLVLKPGRSKLGALLFLTAVVAVCGVGLSLNGNAAGWVLVVAPAAFATVGWRLFTSPRFDLRLNQSGFAFGTLLSRHAFSWCDVHSFGVVGFGPNRAVTLTFAPGVGGGVWTSLTRRVAGF